SVDGSKMDMQYIAYDLTNGKILCQNLFGRNISAIKESNSWASTNITTQGQTISQSPATSITFISQYPFVSDAQIAALAATAKQTSLKSLKNLQNKNYTGVASILKKLGFTINEAQASKVNIAQGQVPTSINFNIGTKLGIMFFKNFWPGATEVAPDITSILQKGDWTTGISLMLLGVDANDNIIPDLTSTDAESFYVMIFDTKTGKNLGGVPIPMTDTTTDNAGGGFSPSHPWSNQIAFGWNAQILTASTTYPFVLTVTSADTSVSIKNAVASVAKDVKSLKKTAKSSKASKAKMTKKQETAAIKKLEGIKSLDPDLTSRIAKLEKSIRKGKITNAEVNRQIKLLDKSLTKYLES
ncbi:MAG TPA: hypothetical protein VLG50_02500, partial [Candidatus Saccharimonadales bacterium]|nr:hypothetical protein [Candidatus Saccharimonadales bacterium]